jgi:hypothetical protein
LRWGAGKVPESKADITTSISLLIRKAPRSLGPGSTEPKALFTDILEVLGSELSKPQLGEAIARAAGLSWDDSCDSRVTPSGGGDTVTTKGLMRVRDAVRRLLGRDY